MLAGKVPLSPAREMYDTSGNSIGPYSKSHGRHAWACVAVRELVLEGLVTGLETLRRPTYPAQCEEYNYSASVSLRWLRGILAILCEEFSLSYHLTD